MLGESLPQPVAEHAAQGVAQQFFNRITRPLRPLNELNERRSRLLSTMTLAVLAIGVLIVLYEFQENPNMFEITVNQVIIVLMAIAFGTYITSRRGHVKAAAAVFIGTLYFIFAIAPFMPQSAPSLIFFNVLPVLITAVFFSMRATAMVAGLIMTTIVILGATIGHATITWAVQQFAMSSAVIFIFINHLRFQEQLRAKELETVNARLRASEENLEIRVRERTRDLEVASDVSLQIATQLDRAALLADVAERTAEAFDLYHVSIFLHDEATQSVSLRQGVGDIGQKMVNAGREYLLDAAGLVPEAARTLRPALSNNIVADPAHVLNPLLPQARAQLAMPMIHRGKLIGVLDLHARTTDRFSDDDIRIIRTLADQIAIAVRNSQLFEETRVALEVAERANAVKSTFLSSMSHELRTPMNAIINFTKFVTKGAMGPVNDQQKETLEEVIDSARHLLNLINDVLDMSKIEAGSLKLFVEQKVDVNALLKSTLTNGKGLLGDKQIDLVTEIDENLPAITGDRQRILQILLNLMSNACKFTEEGSITVKAGIVGEDILISVADTGIGIAAEDNELVFESFKQTESGLRQGGGTGLGLPISRSLAEAHGGRLWFESAFEAGSVFYVSLPLNSTLIPSLGV